MCSIRTTFKKGEIAVDKPLVQTWDLDSLFSGGSDSPQFAAYVKAVEADIASFREQLSGQSTMTEEAEKLTTMTRLLQNILKRIREADSFVSCLSAQNQKDKKAIILSGTMKMLNADFDSSLTLFDRMLTQIPDQAWKKLLLNEGLRQISFTLDERRTLALDKLPAEQESLVNDLAVDGYHGWGDLYNTTVGTIQIPFEEDGTIKELSAGQAANKLDHPKRDVRGQMFQSWEKAWADKADFCADALNHLAGFRLQLYKHRGWGTIHKEPLAVNRMSEKTLQVMWDVIDRNKGMLTAYFERKAELMGLDRLSWHDVDAPLGSVSKQISYDEAAQTIEEQFRKFSPKMADFSIMAFEKRWIEAEDRPGKRPGGFCTSLPDSGQTRIFMTYAGTSSNVSTLAHELGHAYHQHVMNDLPALAQEYAMNVAETASTLAELIVSNAAIQQARSDEEKLALLEDKIQRTVAFFMNIHARFLFETQFYKERKKGLVSVDRLNEIMTEAQKTAYQNALGEYHPHFWAAKLHFYITEVPFYNFPYTFGYLFSAGIYAKALNEGSSFEDEYIALLRDTGSMMVEELAEKHLGVDLTKPDFWQSAADLSAHDVQQFLQMTEDKIKA